MNQGNSLIVPTGETLEMYKSALAKGLDRNGALKKGVTIATGLTWYDLQAPAKNLYPQITPLRNAVPRVHRPNSGPATNWKQVSSLVGSGYNAMGWVPEGQRSGTMSYVTANKAATYVTLGEEDYLTFEAEAAAQGFEDENAMVTFRLLQKMMQKEELAILGGNGGGVQLGTPGTITATSSGTTVPASTLPSATYYSKVVALTLEGLNNSSLASGVATTKTIVGADGKTFVLNGGSSNISAEAGGTSVTSPAPLLLSVPAVNGAMAYAWYVGTVSGQETLQAITTVNSLSLSVALVAGRQSQSAITQDSSSNPNLAYDGLLTASFNPANLASIITQPTGTAGVGTPLTASGRGSVVEIDQLLQNMWDNYRISPTVMYVNSQEMRNITNKVFTGNGNSSLLRLESSAINGGNQLSATAGGMIEFYYNPYTPGGGQKMPIMVHPNVPAGTIIAYAEKLPAWYQNNEVPNVAEVITRRDYYRIDWPERTRAREYGVYAEEVLAIYATFGLGVITNIGNG